MIRTINSAKNPRWSDPTGLRIDLDVDFDELDYDFVQFTAVKRTDHLVDYDYTHDLYDRAVAGEFGEIAEFSGRPNDTGDLAMAQLRSVRDELLAECDHVELATKWAGLSGQEQLDWASYRQALRDLPQNNQNPEVVYTYEILDSEKGTYKVQGNFKNVSFPSKPE